MTTIKLKNGSGAPLAGDLVQGEPALDLTNKRLYTEDSGGTVIEVGTNPTSLTTGGLTVEASEVDIFLHENDRANNNTLLRHSADNFRILSVDDDGSSNLKSRILVEQDTGDISFYEDTGTTAKFFWDASTERLGIGNSAPSTHLDVTGGTTNQVGIFRSSDATATIGFADNTTPLTGNLSYVTLGAVGNNMVFNTNLTEAMRIDSAGNVKIGTASDRFSFLTASTANLQIDGGVVFDPGSGNNVEIFNYRATDMLFGNSGGEDMRIDASGNVGIGTDSPSSYPVAPELVVDADTSGGITVKTGITGYGGVFFADGTTGNEQYRGFVQYNHNNGGSVDELLFGTSGATAMRINSSGNVGIGTSAPSGVRTKIKGLAEATNLATSATSAALFIEPFSGSTWGLGIGSISGQTQYIQGVSAAGTGSRNLAIQPYGGNVGVGTGSPGAKITAYGASGTSISLNNSSTGTTAASGFQLQTGATTDAYIWNYSNGPIAFATNNTERMRLDSSGNLALNSNGSVASLDGVAGMQIGNSSAVSAGVALETNNRGYLMYVDGTSLAFWDSSNNSDRMVINSSGRNSLGLQAESGGIGRVEANGAITVADDATVTLTDAECGALLVHVYDNGSGDGAVFFANYYGGTVIIQAVFNSNFSTSDTDGKYCLFKSSGSHTLTFKNRTGETRNMSFMIVGAQAAKT